MYAAQTYARRPYGQYKSLPRPDGPIAGVVGRRTGKQLKLTELAPNQTIMQKRDSHKGSLILVVSN